MQKVTKILIILVVLTLNFKLQTSNLQAQDTITVMSYNILNYPLSNSTKADTLKAIIKHTQPDIFLITELTSSTGVSLILNDALNVDGITYYQAASYFNGPDTDNMIFYNNQKFGLKSQYEIPTVLRNISEYVLYYKSPNLATTFDTTFVHCYMAHLKASNTPSDSIQRNQEAVTFKNYLDSKSQPIQNIVFGGDFNLYTSDEAAFNTILNGGSVHLNDPINTPGNWQANDTFATIHTQSTRTAVLSDGGSTGGMDDRFDFIFAGDDVMQGTNQMKYISNTYKALGNDGLHYNKSLLANPVNTSVPANVLSALYYMSDHLPIVMKMYYDEALSVNETNTDKNWKGFFTNNTFMFKSTQNEQKLDVGLFDILGKPVSQKKYSNQMSFVFDYSNLQSGMYFIKVSTGSQQRTFRIVKQ
ncbi:MAG: T9SS type A sorting domain-containing protein [Bacteroidetes bacterium]|nr:T9SS type A sorting domain-containing protein [Bacteroidota bacterium]